MSSDAPCCSPTRENSDVTDALVERTAVTPATAGAGSIPTTDSSASGHRIAQASIPSGTFAMGNSNGDGNSEDGETPVHEVFVAAFQIDATCVTNEQFSSFVRDTGYRSEAEVFGYSAVFHLALQAGEEFVMSRTGRTPWWLGVRGADWAHPGGPGSSVAELAEHPVVHISWRDAVAYCAWAGRRLPTEAEWERASRGGLEQQRYPWGDDLLGEPASGDGASGPGGWQCNIWQGTFPRTNTVEDGWPTTAPVHSYAPNAFGLWQSVGNVWEWCSDWYSPHYYEVSPAENPPGPESGSARVLRGGSYLCHDSYCNRYRNAARSSNTPDSSMSNAGFRTVTL